MYINEKTIKTGPALVLWDGITNPETKESGKVAHNLRVAIPNTAPEYTELYALVQAALLASKWKGQLPAGGNLPFAVPDVAKFGPLVANHIAFTASTYRGAPPVYDVAGNKLDVIQYRAALYAGAKVALLVNCFEYDNKQKGIAFGLEGLQIIDANAPHLDVGAAGMPEGEVAAAFGGRPGAGPSTMMPAPLGAGAPPPLAAATPPPPPGAGAPPPPPSQALAPKLYNVGGHNYTAEQLKANGYTDAHLAALG